MTVKELKNCFSRFNLKTKISVPDDREITNEDIEQGKIFQKFILGETLSKTVEGLYIVDNGICYCYVSLDRIEIETDEAFPPCGGEQDLSVYAYYSIRTHHTNGYDNTYISGGKSKVNGVVKLDNSAFTYEKPNLVKEKPNNTEKDIKVNINVSYRFKGVKYEASKSVIQAPNSVSDWMVDEEPTQSIFVTLSQNEVPNKGGIVFAKVERVFTRIYCKKDSCGNKVAGKSEPGLTEDITKKSFLTTSNKKAFSVKENVITVAKQDVGAQERETKITARYLEFSDTVTLKQRKGGVTTYKQELSFADGSKNKFVEIPSSLPTEMKVSLISNEIKYIDGVYDSTKLTRNIKIESDSEWVYGIQGEDDKGINVIVKTTKPNLDKDNDREAELVITNTVDASQTIKLIVSQPALEVYKENYYCEFISDGTYTIEELNNTDLYFHPYKIITYEDGEKERVDIEEDLMFRFESKSSDNSLLKVSSIDKKDGNYYLQFHNLAEYSNADIDIEVKLKFYGEDKKFIFESDTAKIKVKANQKVTYSYDFDFGDDDKYIQVSWINSTEPKYVKINSLKYKRVNGKIAGKEYTPYKVGLYDENCKELFNTDFSIKTLDDEILVFPVKTNKDISNKYTVTQKETGKQISLTLTYKKKKTSRSIPLKVIVYTNSIAKDTWTTDKGYLLIDNTENIKLKPCWLSPSMKENTDVAYNGVIELEDGTHTFETFNVASINTDTSIYKDCNIFKEIKVDKATKNIIIQIKV